MIYDVRENVIPNYTHIKFADDTDNRACLIEYHSDGFTGYLRLVNRYESGDDRIDIDDIDNLIRALEKAKVLWE